MTNDMAVAVIKYIYICTFYAKVKIVIRIQNALTTTLARWQVEYKLFDWLQAYF